MEAIFRILLFSWAAFKLRAPEVVQSINDCVRGTVRART